MWLSHDKKTLLISRRIYRYEENLRLTITASSYNIMYILTIQVWDRIEN